MHSALDAWHVPSKRGAEELIPLSWQRGSSRPVVVAKCVVKDKTIINVNIEWSATSKYLAMNANICTFQMEF